MTLDNIPGTKLFNQRDVRETPASTATATSVGLTDPQYVTLATDADLTSERVLTAGEGINVTDGGAGSTVTISAEDATSTNKGIAKFATADFSVTAGNVNLKDSVVMTADGDTGTATGSGNNLDFIGGTGITTLGSNNDITISTNDSEINHDSLNGYVANEHIDWTIDQGATNINSANYTDTNTTYTAGEGLTLTGTEFSSDINSSIISPIGAVIAWLKSYTNTPQTLPTGWVECNGQTLSDADSVYNGQVIPDLNGDNRFIRGNSTSGGTGGAAAHKHQLVHSEGLTFGTDYDVIDYSSGTYSTSSLPPYYDMVWIMRIK